MTQTQRDSRSDPYGNRPTSPPVSRLPPLESGDHLSRAEFERRYEAMPHLKKAELIEGVVYVPAALRFRSHGKPHAQMMLWLSTYWLATPAVEVADAPTVRLDLDNEPQPDIVLLIDPAAGGQSRLSEDDYIEGAPELIVEIAASSASIDLHTKKQVYRRSGVQEYIVWRSLENGLDWFYLNEGEYLVLPPDADGFLRSRIFPGLWLDVVALCGGDMMQVMQGLQTGIQSSAHAEFVQQLAARRSGQF
ncbi:Uma2 family endonuclease [Thermoleptolyngbya sichuanensis A183]|uniref:Uma2 family endonuclease n=1 Tax=Thermoleptolyngbya sichuanensis A183 TaxID=2737172 RepID=A0A6M8B635_9CYAN|nr:MULTISPECIES: Uma2 family endonuclease [Thermoleptolyngbya]QKD82434.1 Uma2 family endonuclease [Thermoleptolyngbya sichuanensis A183]